MCAGGLAGRGGGVEGGSYREGRSTRGGEGGLSQRVEYIEGIGSLELELRLRFFVIDCRSYYEGRICLSHYRY